MKSSEIGGRSTMAGASSTARRVGLTFALVASILTASEPSGAAPVTPQLQPGFSIQQVFGGLSAPVAVRFAPNGKVFVAEKAGRVRVFDSLSATSSRLVADLTGVVHSPADRGLLGLEVDPQYPTRPYIWVAYTFNAPPGRTAPFYPATSCPTPPGPTTGGCVVQGRLSRLTLNTNDQMVSEQVLITDWCQQFPSHSIGDLRFGNDGALYMSAGDGASYNYTDYGQEPTGGGSITPTYTPANPCGDPPGSVGTPLSATTSQGGALRSLSFRRAAGLPVSLDGSVIRVDPDTGAALPTNPAAGDANANRRRIIAYGLRNPYRITKRPGTNEIWTTNVGQNTTEWINRIPNPTGSVLNFGWPCYEGSQVQPGYQALNNFMCNSVYSQGFTPPYYEYRHNGPGSQIGSGFEGVNGTQCRQGSGALTGAAFYNGGYFGSAQPTSNYPAAYDGALFFTDFTRRCIYAMRRGADGLPDPNQIIVVGAEVTGTTDAGAVALEAGPDGRIWFVDIINGAIKRLVYTANNPPVAVIGTSPSPANINPGQTVQFNSTGSNDPAGGTLTYSWDLNGDGVFGDATTPTASRTYTTPGDVTVRLRVTNSAGVSTTAQTTVHVAASQVIIDTPTTATRWSVGSPVSFSGRALDWAGNPLPASALSWKVEILHCPNFVCHTHDLEPINGVASGQFIAPDHEYPSSLVVKLTANNGGVLDTTSVEIQPNTNTLTVLTNPPGLNVAVNEAAGPSPRTITVIRGSQNSLSAPNQFFGGQNYQFVSWSDGGAQSHNVTVNADTTLTANFAVNSSGVLPPPQGGGWQLNGAATLTTNGVRLTPATTTVAGSVFYPAAVPSGSITAEFDFNISGGNGADGMTFVLADPTAPATSLGGTGGLLGFGGIPGIAVAFDTYKGATDPSSNFVGITNGMAGSAIGYTTTNTAVPPLQGTTRRATITTTGGRLKVSIDGVQYLDQAVTLPPTVKVGFTAATGGLTNIHTVSNININTATTGGGGGTPTLTVTPNPASFGNVTVGSTGTVPLTIANTGTAPLTIATVTPPAAPFGATGLPAPGATIPAGGQVLANLTFTPTTAGTSNGTLTITSNGGNITIPTTGTGTTTGTTLPPPQGGGWQLNGAATLTTNGVRLTPATTTQRGSVFYGSTIPSANITAEFDINISGGNGADGMTFVLANPTAPATSLGGSGGLMGFGGIPGIAVAFDTFRGPGDPSANFVGITDGLSGGSLRWVTTNTSVPPLRNATRRVVITTSGGRLRVSIDGVQYLDQAVTLPPTVRVGFTAATGGLFDNHVVTNAQIRYS
jgi:glucose/arabinose dehydrogenase